MNFDTDTLALRLPFGKHRDLPLSEVPTSYLNWLVNVAPQRDPFGPAARFANDHGAAIIEAMTAARRQAAADFDMDFTLSADQGRAVEAAVRFFTEDNGSIFTLNGGAGYGKSFVTKAIVRALVEATGCPVVACAPSRVAADVLDAHLGGLDVPCGTIASTFYLTKVDTEEQEDYVVTPKSIERMHEMLRDGGLVVMDEGYMASDEVAMPLMDIARERQGRLLVVGDPYQLPPVKQSTPSAFLRVEDGFTLTQPMRYSTDSDLYVLEQLARHQPENIISSRWDDSDEVHVHGSMKALADQYVADLLANPREDLRLLLHRRADVQNANAWVRWQAYGDASKTDAVIEDERLMVLKTMDLRDPAHTDMDMMTRRCYSSTTHFVKSVREGEHLGTPCYFVEFTAPVGRPKPLREDEPPRPELSAEVPVLFVNGEVADADRRGGPEYAARCRELAEHAKTLSGREAGEAWKAYRVYRDSFLQVGYSYAMTVHRAQGQTVDRVYFSPKRFNGLDRHPLIYVSGTRAKRAVHMVDPESAGA